MASVKLILRKNKPNKKGECPIMIQITHDRKSTEMSSTIYVEPGFWDERNEKVKSKHVQQIMLNAHLSQKKQKIGNLIIDWQLTGKSFTAREVVAEIKKEKPKSDLIFDYIDSFKTDNPKGLKSKTIDGYGTLMFRINKFDSKARFSDVNTNWIRRFEKFQKDKLGLAVNSIHSTFKNLKSILNFAIADGRLTDNPFDNYKLTKEESKIEFLTEKEIEAVKNVELSGKLAFYRDLFLFGCYTGLRFSDICTLKKNEIEQKDNRKFTLYKKIRKVEDYLSIPLSANAIAIIKKYLRKEDGYLFPLLNGLEANASERKMAQQIATKTTLANLNLKKIKALAGLEKNLTTHIARHTFATYLLNKGVEITVVSKLLGHKKLTQTQVYAKVIDSSKEAAIDKIEF